MRRQLVEPGDQQGLLGERVAAARGLDHVLGEDLEVQAELLPQLVLPLLDQAARGDDQAPLNVAADHQLLDQQSPAMIVLPAPGSSASRKRSGWRGSISS